MGAASMAVYRIIGELDEASKSDEVFLTTWHCENPKSIQILLRQYAKGKEWLPRLVTATDGSMFFARLKEIPRETRLQLMLEKVLPCVDDENLYDECLDVLYGGENGNGKKR